jgi:hypothetical protein
MYKACIHSMDKHAQISYLSTCVLQLYLWNRATITCTCIQALSPRGVP